MLSAVVSRLVGAAALVVVVALFFVAPSPVVAVFVGAPAVLAFSIGSRFRIDRATEAAVSFGALAAGAILPRLFAVDTTNMPQFLSDRGLFFVCPLLFLGGARALLRQPTYGVRGTIALLLVALAGAGRAKAGVAFPVLVALFLTLAALSLFATDPSRSLPRDGRTRALGGLATGTVIAAFVALGIALPLPAVHARLVERIMSRFSAKSGFSDGITLGDLHGMLMSDRVVARVRNGSPAHLRGAVYGTYANGGWSPSATEEAPAFRQGDAEPSDPSRFVAIEFARRPERYFLPRDATDVATSAGVFYENKLGIRWAAASSEWAKRVWYAPSENKQLAGPAVVDNLVPHPLRRELQAVLDEWGVTRSMTPEERVEAIDRELGRRYAYSLDYDRTPGVDFVVDFLKTHKQGHCEYFASAFVLLVRQAGVQARVVAGYRVSERSPLSDYWLVRERNAHTWAEVWLGDRWTTWDPTPPDALAAQSARTPLLSATWDLLSTSWEKVDDFLSARSPFELTLALVGLVGLLILVRAIRVRRHGPAIRERSVDPPLPGFVALERVLDERGLGRSPNETLEVFAGRLEAAARKELLPSVDAIRAYANHRYGGAGEQGEVERALQAAAHGFG